MAATTRIYYEGNGSTTDFTIPFDYLSKRFIQVYIDNVLKTGGSSGDESVDYYFPNATTIRFRTAPETGVQILIKRFTIATDRIVDFQDASVFNANDLNTAQLQVIHIAEEGRDIIDDALIVNTEGQWDARNRRIVNLADPIDAQDAMTYGLYLADASGSKVAAEEAAASAEEAKGYAESASSSLAETKEIAQTVADSVEEIEHNVELAQGIQEDVTNKRDEVNTVQQQINDKADEVLQSFNDTMQAVDEAVQDVTDTKDYVETIVNNNVVQSGLACARSTWKLTEDLPAGTTITIPDNPVYVVGRRHLFISYDGIVMSPSFYKEIGEFNTLSSQVAFNFDLKAGQELTAWVVTLGNSDSEIYGRITAIEETASDAVAKANEAIENTNSYTESINNATNVANEAKELVTQVSEDNTQINSTLDSISGSVSSNSEAIETLQNTTSEQSDSINELTGNFNTISQKVTTLESTSSEHTSNIQTLNENINTVNEALSTTNDAVEKLQESTSLFTSFSTFVIDGTDPTFRANKINDTLKINAGDNITLTPDTASNTLTISSTAQSAEVDTAPEIAVVSSIDDVPDNLKVGGIVLLLEESE